jgi:hypothetical protein
LPHAECNADVEIDPVLPARHRAEKVYRSFYAMPGSQPLRARRLLESLFAAATSFPNATICLLTPSSDARKSHALDLSQFTLVLLDVMIEDL